MEYKKVSDSEVVLTELMIPSYANFGGKVHGGIILSLMDKVAYVCASKHTGKYCVTVNVSGVSFMAPVEVGDLVSLFASVNYVGKTSLTIGIKVVTENFTKKTIKHSNTSYFTFVAMGEDGKPTEIPGLQIENEEELRRFVEGKLRKDFSIKNNQEFDRIKLAYDNQERMEILKNDNCLINLV
ncbi:MAG: hypothetical protein RLZZ414_1640 [Bacteroidota bacterium]|jgi:uncharacterized protein (TIGR00369 family)